MTTLQEALFALAYTMLNVITNDSYITWQNYASKLRQTTVSAHTQLVKTSVNVIYTGTNCQPISVDS